MAFQLKTAAFPPNGRIPEIYTCEGEDVPPPLAWSGAPAGTKSFALIVDDPDAPGGTFCHWAIFDIGPAVTNVGDEIPLGAHQAVNDFGRMGYGGPCPRRPTRVDRHHLQQEPRCAKCPRVLDVGNDCGSYDNQPKPRRPNR
jgi:Raf kinase inhibitor-like YbhB/YbcL family protein